MVFVGNINQSVDVLLKTSSLFDPFPPEMGTDTAFLDRLHCYIPGWEIPKFRPEHFTNDYGFITDYLAEFIRELRKEQYGDALDKYFRLGKNLNQRDTIAVRKIVGGYVKLLYPDGEFTKEQIEEILVFALEMRRRVKEQLKKLGGMEFYDVNFSYIDLDTFEEKFVSVPEQGGGKLIPDGICNPGQVYTISQGKSGMIGVFRLESQMLPGNGKFERTGLGSDRDCKESTNTAFNFLKANGNRISGSISTTMRDYIINYQDLQGIGMTGKLALPTLIALCSIALGRPTVSTLAVLGEISISGTILKVDELANSLQVCLDSGAKKVLLPITSAADLGTVPPELVGSFNLIFYSSAEDAVSRFIPIKSVMIDSSNYRYQNGSDVYISRVVKDFLEPEDITAITQAHRNMIDEFAQNEAIQSINEKISAASTIMDGKLSLSADQGFRTLGSRVWLRRWMESRLLRLEKVHNVL